MMEINSQKLDEDTREQERQIKEEIARNQPLVGNLEPISSLEKDYKENPTFLKKIAELRGKYKSLRRVRGDGNCFYRSFLFRTLERMSEGLRAEADEQFQGKKVVSELFTRWKRVVKASLDQLCKAGFERFTIEDFYEMLEEQVEWIGKERPTGDEVLERICDESVSMYLVYYARFMTSAHLKSNAESFSPYLPPESKSIVAFCKEHVEPMDRESDYLQCVAFANALGVAIQIEYLDLSSGKLNNHVFPEGSEPFVHLLYRPGHYDVLYC